MAGAFEQAGFQLVLKDLDKYLTGAAAVTKANTSIDSTLAKAGRTASSIVGDFAKLTAGVGAMGVALGAVSLKSAASFETILARVDALTNTTTEDTAKLGKGILDLARRVPKSPNELGEAAYFALSSGIESVDEALKVVESSAKAAAAGLGSTKDVVDIVTAAINAYGPANITAAQATDTLVAAVREGKGEPAQMATALGTLLPLAAALKVPFTDLAATFASLTNELGGTEGTYQAATQLRGILGQLASPSDKAKKTLDSLGIFTGKTSKELVKATKSSEDLADAENKVKIATDALAIAKRKLADTDKTNGRQTRQTSQETQAAQLAVERATRTLTNAQQDLAEVQGKSRDQIVETTDAFGGLRAEIAEKGLVPTLIKLRDATADNIEALGDIFPDIRGFIGFLSAIQSQGEKTAEIQKRIAAATGLTDEAFAKISETFNFQAGLLKNELNIALIELGSKILPTATKAVEAVLVKMRELGPQLSEAARIFGLAFKGRDAEIAGTAKNLEGLAGFARDLGRDAAAMFKAFTDNKDAIKQALEIGSIANLQAVEDIAKYFAEHGAAIGAAFALAFAIFARTHPIGAILFAGAGLVTVFAIMRQDIDTLDPKLLAVRRQIDELLIKFGEISDVIQSGGLSAIGINPIKAVGSLFGGQTKAQQLADSARADLAQVNDVLHNFQENANALDRVERVVGLTGTKLEAAIADQLRAVATLGPGIGDTLPHLLDLVAAYDSLNGSQGQALKDFPGLKKQLDNLGKSTDTTTTSVASLGSTTAAQTQPITEAQKAWQGGMVDVLNKSQDTKEEVSRLGPTAQNQKPFFDTFKIGAVADLDEIQKKAEAVATAIASIVAAEAQAGDTGKLGEPTGGNSRATASSTGSAGIARRASGGIEFVPRTVSVAEGGLPEAIIPLTKPARARQIFGQLPAGLLQQLIPRNIGGAASPVNINLTVGDAGAETEARAIRAVQGAFRQLRYQALNAGAPLTIGVG